MMLPNKTSPSFYDLLENQAKIAHEAAKVLDSLVLDFGRLPDYLAQLETLEHEGDRLTHAFINKVNTLFITPMDKEDLHGLSDLRGREPDAGRRVHRLGHVVDELLHLVRHGVDVNALLAKARVRVVQNRPNHDLSLTHSSGYTRRPNT